MSETRGDRAVTTVPGVLTLLAWTLYVLLNAPQLPDVFPSVLVAGAFGILAWLSVVVNFRYWRFAVLIASAVYLLLYAVRVGRMAMIGVDAGQSSVLSGLSHYYGMLWQVSVGAFQEKGAAGGLTQIFLEYVMPILVVVTILATLVSWRSKRS